MADQIAEVMEVMIDEGIEPCFTISSGSLPEKIYCEAVIRIIQVIEKRPECAHVIPRLMCQMEVPKDLSWLNRLYEHGVRRVDMNIEVWDPDMFRLICPGKSKRIGSEHWLRGLRYAQKLFGAPYVYTGIVAGPEPKKTLYQATDELTEMGLWPLITPWWTQGGTQFDGHRSPHPEWCLEVTEKCVDRIVERIPQFMDEAFFYWFMGGCYRCDDVVIMPDELRVRYNGLKKVFPKEAKLDYDNEGTALQDIRQKLRWKHANRYRLGLEWTVGESLRLRTGLALDQSGLPGEAQGFTMIPNPTSWYFPLGFAVRWRGWLIEGSFAFLWGLDRQGRGDIHQNDKIMSLSFSRAFLGESR